MLLFGFTRGVLFVRVDWVKLVLSGDLVGRKGGLVSRRLRTHSQSWSSLLVLDRWFGVVDAHVVRTFIRLYDNASFGNLILVTEDPLACYSCDCAMFLREPNHSQLRLLLLLGHGLGVVPVVLHNAPHTRRLGLGCEGLVVWVLHALRYLGQLDR